MSLVGELVETAGRELEAWANGGLEAAAAGRDALLAIDAARRLLGNARCALMDDLQRAGISTGRDETERSMATAARAAFGRIRQVRHDRWPDTCRGDPDSGEPFPGTGFTEGPGVITPGTTMLIEPSLVEELDQRAAKDRPRSAFTAIGGTRAVVAVVEEFYTRLLRDQQTAPFFEPLVQSDGMSTLKRDQALTLVAALGGPSRYTGWDLYAVHRGLGITQDAYRRVCLHLLTTLHDFQVPMDILVDVDLLLRRLQDLIVTTPNEVKPDEVKPDDTTPKDAGEETGQG